MFKPNFQLTQKIVNYLTEIAEARAIILHAPLVPKWELNLRKEALLKSTHASTAIEGNNLSLEEISDLMIGRDITARYKDKKEVLNYFAALEHLDQLVTPAGRQLTNADILELHQLITHDTLENQAYSGHYRSGNEYVVVANRFTGEISFRPPATVEVPFLMDNLVGWLNEKPLEHINPVIEAGITHYEFVRIHPFIDGNGRTGRVLATYVLIKRGFDTKRFFALDDFYNSDRSRYYQVLKGINQTTLDTTPWLEYFCEGVAVSIKAVKDKVLLLTSGRSKTVGDEQIAIDDRQIRIVEFIKKGGRISNKQIRELLNVSNKTAYQLVEDLIKNKVIKKIGDGRSTEYILR